MVSNAENLFIWWRHHLYSLIWDGTAKWHKRNQDQTLNLKKDTTQFAPPRHEAKNTSKVYTLVFTALSQCQYGQREPLEYWKNCVRRDAQSKMLHMLHKDVIYGMLFNSKQIIYDTERLRI